MDFIKNILLFLFIDIFLTKYHYKAKDVIRSFVDFSECEKYKCNEIVISLIYGLHLYHSIYYRKKLGIDDITHHVSALCICVPLALYFSPGSLLGYSFFFTTGLPGMINYFLLWKERNGLYDRKMQKNWNRFLNVWIRNPGCISCATLILLKSCVSPNQTCWNFAASILVSLITLWNGSYFMEQVVSDYAKRYLIVQ